MKKIISFTLISIILFGCSINFEKRRYRKGYHVDVVKNLPNKKTQKSDTSFQHVIYEDETTKIDAKLNMQDSIEKANPHVPSLLKNKTKTKKMDQKIEQKPIFIPEKINDKNIIKTKPENLPSPPVDDVLKKRKMWAWILGGAAILCFIIFLILFFTTFGSVFFISIIVLPILFLSLGLASLLLGTIKSKSEKIQADLKRKEKLKNLKDNPVELDKKRNKTAAWILGAISIVPLLIGGIMAGVYLPSLAIISNFVFYPYVILALGLVLLLLALLYGLWKPVNTKVRDKIGLGLLFTAIGVIITAIIYAALVTLNIFTPIIFIIGLLILTAALFILFSKSREDIARENADPNHKIKSKFLNRLSNRLMLPAAMNGFLLAGAIVLVSLAFPFQSAIIGLSIFMALLLACFFYSFTVRKSNGKENEFKNKNTIVRVLMFVCSGAALAVGLFLFFGLGFINLVGIFGLVFSIITAIMFAIYGATLNPKNW